MEGYERARDAENFNRGVSIASLKPMGDRVVIRRPKAEEETAGGIIIPKNAQEEARLEGTIVAIGGDVAVDVSIGDKVIFAQFAGAEIPCTDGKAILLNEEDLLAVVGSEETSPVARAMEVLKQAFLRDDSFAHGWHCNLAMSFYDATKTPYEVRHREANEGASRFMFSAFGVETSNDMLGGDEP